MSTSAAWDYFAKCIPDVSKAQCRLCQERISRGRNPSSFSTSAMLKHLKSRHDINPETRPQKREAPAASSDQLGIEESMLKRKKFDASHPTAKEITRKIGEMIGADFLPFSVVENQGFRRLINRLEPRYVVPCRKHMTDKAVPDVYHKVGGKIKLLLENAVSPISSTTDIWTSQQNDPFLSVTANFVVWQDGNLARYTPVLRCKHFTGSHTADAILGEMKAIEQEWGITFDAVVSDNASNMTRAFDDGDIFHVRCLAHTLNLVVRHALDCQRSIKDTVAASRAIVGHYHRSSRDTEHFHECQKRLASPNHKLIQDVSTRWNSTYHMIERLIEQKEVINDLSYRGIGSTLTLNQWRIAGSLVKVLKIFDKATLEISSENATISCILPVVTNLCKKVDKFTEDREIYGIGTFLQELADQLDIRFCQPTESIAQGREAYFQTRLIYDRCVLAAVMDPRIKTSWCSTAERQQVQELIMSKLEIAPHIENVEDNISSDEDEDSMIFQRRNDEPEPPNHAPAMNANENFAVTKYLTDPLFNMKKSPLEFWSKYSDSGVLFRLAMKVLSCPPTSVDSERLFSSAGIVNSPLRNRLTPINVEMLTFLHVNLKKKINFEY